MENQIREVFFQLLRIGLWGKGNLSFDRLLTDEEWTQIYKNALNRTVEGIIYASFDHLEHKQLPPQYLRLKWAVRIDQIERINTKMNKVIIAQYGLFTKNKIQPILQKGQGVAQNYNIPLHRVSGDVDWCFQDDDYAAARDLLKKKNIKFQDTAGFSLDYDLHGIHIEHHKNLFDIRNPFKSKYLKRLEIEYRYKHQEVLINDVKIKLLAPELQILQVNAHILKHLITFGIGLRQFCDSARLYHETSTQIDSVALKKIYKELGILKWIHALHLILVKYLNLPLTSLPFPYPEDLEIDWMIDEVWYSGNFGYTDERFEKGKKSIISMHPDGGKRLWSNFKRYFKYAPTEVLYYPIIEAYSKYLGKDKD
ncbi:nucleotidyltransferase family protein [Sphingobacterium faecium]